MILDFSKLEDPKLMFLLAIGCQCLNGKLKEIQSCYRNQSVYTGHQIELRPISKNSVHYHLFLRMDLEKCYKLERHNDKDIKPKIKTHINRIRNECNGASFSESTNRMNCNSQQRPSPCTRLSGCEKQCGFFVCDAHQIYMKDGTWYAAARCSGHRIITINPNQHCDNKQWLGKKETWALLCQIIHQLKTDLQLKKLPIERIFINHGCWQSQAATVLNPDDCHAHANMVLTKKAIEACMG